MIRCSVITIPYTIPTTTYLLGEVGPGAAATDGACCQHRGELPRGTAAAYAADTWSLGGRHVSKTCGDNRGTRSLTMSQDVRPREPGYDRVSS